ncbi:hypothetical protein [Photobacterium leiognathi]|uniref:hypothetical protein n=1 Tax=Photobacterium leiognathi TaxID=553611 RepID=UPI0029813C65|nr:hypothetical protein [Photobacterium leiognathi]
MKRILEFTVGCTVGLVLVDGSFFTYSTKKLRLYLKKLNPDVCLESFYYSDDGFGVCFRVNNSDQCVCLSLTKMLECFDEMPFKDSVARKEMLRDYLDSMVRYSRIEVTDPLYKLAISNAI